MLDGLKFSNDRMVFFLFVGENFGILEVFDETIEALQTGIGELAYLLIKCLTFSLLNLPHLLQWKLK